MRDTEVFIESFASCDHNKRILRAVYAGSGFEGLRLIILRPHLAIRFDWEFEDEGCGTRMRQRIRATGLGVEKYMEVFRQMEAHAPKGMAQLAAKLAGLLVEDSVA